MDINSLLKILLGAVIASVPTIILAYLQYWWEFKKITIMQQREHFWEIIKLINKIDCICDDLSWSHETLQSNRYDPLNQPISDLSYLVEVYFPRYINLFTKYHSAIMELVESHSDEKFSKYREQGDLLVNKIRKDIKLTQ